MLLETEVREEVSNEMANLLRDMEANYRVCTYARAFSPLIPSSRLHFIGRCAVLLA